MSGGVDSSVAALVLAREGHDVVGLTMRLWSDGEGTEDGARSCFGPEAASASERVASELGIPHRVLPMEDVFENEVVSGFVGEYARGRTPNPCVSCNAALKFGELLARAMGLGADALATGHHARIVGDAPEGLRLARARDGQKDQSYFLYRLRRENLALLRFPVGELEKEEVRRLAREAGLHTADRAESQDVCFASSTGIGPLLRKRVPGAATPGRILDREGRIVGEHRGVGFYTVGQRSGLGLSAPRAQYVVAIDAARNALVVGEEEELYSRSLLASGAHWTGPTPAHEFRAEAKVRSTSAPAACLVRRDGEHLHVEFDEPERAISPGQAVVLYDGEIVLGGATIEGSREGRLPERS